MNEASGCNVKEMNTADLLAFRKQVLGDPSELMIVGFECKKLPKVTNFVEGHGTDPYCVIYEVDQDDEEKETKIGMTEV